MELLKCPRCGEMYSPSYRKCPFCEEEEKPKKLRYDNRNGRRLSSEKKPTHSPRGAIVTILVLVLGLLTWYLFGDGPAKEKEPLQEPQQTVEETPSTEPSEEPAEVDPGVSSPPVIGQPTDEPQNVDISAAKLSSTDFTAKAGEKVQLSVKGIAEGVSVSWSSENGAVASVDGSGLVTAVSGGTTNITATVGDKTLSCIVRVSGGSSAGSSQSADVSVASLNYSDFTAKVGEKVQLKVRGTSTSVSWSIGDPAVASVSAEGLVKGLNPGQTKVYAKVGDKTLSCTVRIR